MKRRDWDHHQKINFKCDPKRQALNIQQKRPKNLSAFAVLLSKLNKTTTNSKPYQIGIRH